MRTPTLLLGAVLASSALGCWSSTQSLTAGAAGPGEAGFGTSAHTHTAYMVLAAAVATFTATGNVAMVDEGQSELPTDSLWEAYDGGRKVRHCFVVQGGKHVCSDAVLPDESIGWGKSVVFVDPVNLGRYLEVVEASATDGDNVYYVYAASGGVSVGDIRMPLGPKHGVWAVIAGDNTVMHCQLEGNTPRCRAMPADVTGFFTVKLLDAVLGVFSNKDQNILWIAKPQGVFRCTASAARPDPSCVAAQIQ